jgi:hypothetical protein
MQTRTKEAASLQGNGKVTLSHETAKDSLSFSFHTLTKESALLALLGGEDYCYTLRGASVADILDLTVKSSFHYSRLMDGEVFISEYLMPLRIFYTIMSGVQQIFIKHNDVVQLIRKDSLTPEEAILVLTNALYKENITLAKNTTIEAIFYYTSLMEKHELHNDLLWPYQLFYKILLNIESLT